MGHPGGGYPGTLEDVAAAIDHLAELDEPLDLGDVTLVGHSAGGHLALWAVGRPESEFGDPGSGPEAFPHTVVAQAAGLLLAGRTGSGGHAEEQPSSRAASAKPDGVSVQRHTTRATVRVVQ